MINQHIVNGGELFVIALLKYNDPPPFSSCLVDGGEGVDDLKMNDRRKTSDDNVHGRGKKGKEAVVVTGISPLWFARAILGQQSTTTRPSYFTLSFFPHSSILCY